MLNSRSPRSVLLVTFGFLLSAPALAQFGEPVGSAGQVLARDAHVAERLIELAKRDNRVYETVRTITTQHPKRLTGSKGFDRAADWARAQFQSYGLEAHLEKWGEFPVAFDRGVQKGAIVSPEKLDLTFATSAWTVGTKGPSRGRAILEPRSEEELAKLDVDKDLKDAWIVRGESKADAKFKKKLRELYEKAGIFGTVRPGSKSGLLVMAGYQKVDLDKLTQIPDIKVVPAQFDALVARLEKGEAIELEFDIQNEFTKGPVACNNIVAELKGTQFPDEYVIVQGHFDAWDGAQGAQDNGTGSATTLEAARLIAASGIKPLRSIRFVLYSGEEQGLFGSIGYVRDHKDELDHISVVMTHDAGGTFLAGIDATYAMADDMHSVTEKLVALDPARPFAVHEVDGLQNSGDSDHAPFIGAGVPAFFWHQSEKGYDHVHHTQFDTFEEIDRGDLEHSAVVVAVCALGFANLDHLLDRTDMAPVQRRRLGVNLEADATLSNVSDDGLAHGAGWMKGDKVLSVDGVAVSTKDEVVDKLQQGGSKKTFRIQRGTEVLETAIDYSKEPGEKVRAERAARRATFEAARSAKQ
jgi:carboxypeptidase Q